MVRRYLAPLVLAGLALGLGACQAANASTDSWHPPIGEAGAQPAVSASTSHAPSTAPVRAKTSPSPSAHSASPDPSTTDNTGGPAGSINTTGTSAVALTFDDGPDASSMAVLDLLAQYHVKATFCIIGRQVADHPDVIRRIVADGHTLCNHTWDHDLNLANGSTDHIRAEMQQTSDAIHAVVPDAKIAYFRAPGGGFSTQVDQIASDMGMRSLDWNVDPQDWTKPGVQAIISNVMTHTDEGSIVLMHDGGGDRSQTVEALHTILPNFTGRFTLIPMPV